MSNTQRPLGTFHSLLPEFQSRTRKDGACAAGILERGDGVAFDSDCSSSYGDDTDNDWYPTHPTT